MKQGTPISLQDFTDDLRHSCAVHVELSKEWIREQQTINWPHINHFLPCRLPKMCASLCGCQ
eukprot:988765-Pelagomonas_calceolata.AAC.1